MIVGQMARAALPIGIFFTIVPGLLLLGEHPGSAGFVITTFTLALGVIFLATTLIALRITRRLSYDDRPDFLRSTSKSEEGEAP